jgi:hypothetical protein
MCLLALEMKKNGGCEGFCYPPYLYPGQGYCGGGPLQPELSHSINIFHGHQLNNNVIMFILDIVAPPNTYQRDGNYAYNRLQYYMAKGDPCIASITKDWGLGGDAHSLIAYNCEDDGATKRIYVYDCNRPFCDSIMAENYYGNKSNYIEITTSTGAWKFTMADGTTVYKGSPDSGGNIIMLPLSIVAPRDRLPESLVADISTIVISGSGADVIQVTTVSGRHLFKPGTRELETDKSKRIENIFPFNPFVSKLQKSKDKKMILFYRSNEPLDLDVKNAGHGYTVAMIGSKGFASVKAINGSGVERIRIENVNTLSPKVKIANQTKPSYYQVELRSIVKENEKVQVYSIDKINPEVNSHVNIMISRGGSGIEMISDKKVPQFELRVSETGKEKINPVKQSINLEQGKPTKISIERSADRKELKLKIKENE